MLFCCHSRRLYLARPDYVGFEKFMNKERETVYDSLSKGKNFLILEDGKLYGYKELPKYMRRDLKKFKRFEDYIIVITPEGFFVYSIARAALKFRISSA